MRNQYEYAYIVRLERNGNPYWLLDKLGGDTVILDSTSNNDDILIPLNIAGQQGWYYKERINARKILVERKVV